jgi:hypothetical protein
MPFAHALCEPIAKRENGGQAGGRQLIHAELRDKTYHQKYYIGQMV